MNRWTDSFPAETQNSNPIECWRLNPDQRNDIDRVDGTERLVGLQHFVSDAIYARQFGISQ
jgi:hypothetical protein